MAAASAGSASRQPMTRASPRVTGSASARSRWPLTSAVAALPSSTTPTLVTSLREPSQSPAVVSGMWIVIWSTAGTPLRKMPTTRSNWPAISRSVSCACTTKREPSRSSRLSTSSAPT